MYNKVILIGRLTRDPEQRSSENGTKRVTFSLAVDREYEIEGQPKADFIDIVAFKKTAEFVAEWFEKGMLILVEGRMQTRKWRDRDGNNRISVEVVAEKARFAETKKAKSDVASENSAAVAGNETTTEGYTDA